MRPEEIEFLDALGQSMVVRFWPRESFARLDLEEFLQAGDARAQHSTAPEARSAPAPTRVEPTGDVAATGITASFETGSEELMEGILRRWLPTDGELRIRLHYELELYYDANGVELYAHREDAGSYFLANGHVDGPSRYGIARIMELAALCHAEGVAFSIDYEPLDSGGDPFTREPPAMMQG